MQLLNLRSVEDTVVALTRRCFIYAAYFIVHFKKYILIISVTADLKFTNDQINSWRQNVI